MQPTKPLFRLLPIVSIISLGASQLNSIPDLSFTWQAPTQAIGHPVVADLNGDSKGDLVLHVHVDTQHIKDPSREPGLYWFAWPLKEFGVLFRGPVTGDRFDTADLNGDGRTDIISGRLNEQNEEAVCWYENPGNEALQSGKPWKEYILGIHNDHIKDILCRDLDGDGRLDIIARGHAISTLFINTGKGWKKRVLNHPRREGLALGDLDLDGDVDLVMNGFWFETPDDLESGTFAMHTIDEKWFTQDTGSWQDNAASVAVGDLNNDGLPDVVLGHSETVGYPLSWYSVKSADEAKSGPWTEHQVVSEFKWCETIDLGDMDMDGDLDIFAAKFERHGSKSGPWANFAPFPVVLYLNNGDGSSWASMQLADHGVYAGKLGDLGGDGDLDIVGPESYYRGPIHVWINQLVE